jgi:hypothetical protein
MPPQGKCRDDRRLFDRMEPKMSRKVLVCILAQTRAHRLTWASFEKQVLNELNADLAVCIGVDDKYDYTNPYFQHALFRWTIPVPADWAEEIDRIRLSLGYDEGWRRLADLCENPYSIFLGGAFGIAGSGAILLAYRWHLRNFIIQEGLHERYERFIVTRSDFLYTAPHPCIEALDPAMIWIPDGEDWGGLADRHMVVSGDHVAESLSALSDILRNPKQWADALELRDVAYRNSEGVLEIHFQRTGLMSRVRRFPYVMYLVRDASDPTGWTEGEFDSELGLYIKYPTEFERAQHWKDRFRSRADWLEWAKNPCGETIRLPGDNDVT